jgi:hypothetical protein
MGQEIDLNWRGLSWYSVGLRFSHHKFYFYHRTSGIPQGPHGNRDTQQAAFHSLSGYLPRLQWKDLSSLFHNFCHPLKIPSVYVVVSRANTENGQFSVSLMLLLCRVSYKWSNIVHSCWVGLHSHNTVRLIFAYVLYTSSWFVLLWI